jgi:hypothetical protein
VVNRQIRRIRQKRHDVRANARKFGAIPLIRRRDQGLIGSLSAVFEDTARQKQGHYFPFQSDEARTTMSIQTFSSRNPDINDSLNFSGPRRHNHNAIG